MLVEGKVGILNNKPVWLLSSLAWNAAFYTHIVLGGLSLLIGWLQFSTKLRLRKPTIHKLIGKIYVCAVPISSLSGIYLALFADDRFWASLGFACLAAIWFSTILMAYNRQEKTVR